jgi:hypothetical protein
MMWGLLRMHRMGSFEAKLSSIDSKHKGREPNLFLLLSE